MPDTQVEELEKMLDHLDDNEKAMLLYTLSVVKNLKSKGAKTRRFNDLAIWVKEYRAQRAA